MAVSKTGQSRKRAHLEAFISGARSADEVSRLRRSETSCKDTVCLVAYADVKKYVESTFGVDSPQYRQIQNLKFTPPGRIPAELIKRLLKKKRG